MRLREVALTCFVAESSAGPYRWLCNDTNPDFMTRDEGKNSKCSNLGRPAYDPQVSQPATD